MRLAVIELHWMNSIVLLCHKNQRIKPYSSMTKIYNTQTDTTQYLMPSDPVCPASFVFHLENSHALTFLLTLNFFSPHLKEKIPNLFSKFQIWITFHSWPFLTDSIKYQLCDILLWPIKTISTTDLWFLVL
jgi:hypothetical protein